MDFREVIRKNNFRTKLVVSTYVIIMCIVGLLVDTVTHSNIELNLSQNLLAFATFEQIPIATLIILAITIIGIIVIHFYGHKLMLSGMNAKELDPTSSLSSSEQQLVNIIEELSLSASLGYTPKLYLLDTPEPNAFAAGWSSKNALVGVTRGLLERLNRHEVQAVLAHEVGHIIHGDSKLTLYVGILANVILTITNIFGQMFYFATPGNQRGGAANKARLLLLLLNMVLPIITQVLYLYLSRTREYMADAAAVELTQDNQAMISALRKISGDHEANQYEHQSTGQAYRSAAYIFNKGDSVFSTHPSIENRIAALEGKKP